MKGIDKMEIMNVKIVTLFLEGVLSFFSPCVLPIIPIYFGILGSNLSTGEGNKKQTLWNVFLFILGICSTFFLLGSLSQLLNAFFRQHLQVFKWVGAILIILMGAFQLGLIKSKRLMSEFSIRNKVFDYSKKLSPIVCFLMGLTFSFSWTPCVGPILASVFFYSSSQDGALGMLLIMIYCIGFIIPFILVAMFSQKLLAYFKTKYHLLHYTGIVSGVVLILIGISMLVA